jgi:membrane protein
MVRLVRATVERFVEQDLLSYASAVAFRVLYALVPLALAVLAFLGFFGLGEVWTESIAPDVEDQIDANLFAVVDDTVRSILDERRTVWLTFGVAFAVWQVSSAVRAVSGPLNVLRGDEEQRSTLRRVSVSILAALAITPLLVLAMLSITIGHRATAPLDLGPVGSVATFVLRWGITVVAMLIVVGVVLRFAPCRPEPRRWRSLGPLLVVGSWLVSSLAFALYLREIADYESVYGGLASIIVLLSYLYLLAILFFLGVQADDVLHEHADGGVDAEIPVRLRHREHA